MSSIADYQSAEEVRAEQIQMMGSDLGALYHELWREVTWLHLKWNRFLALFVEEEARIDLMNDTAPAFFGEAQRLIAEDVFIHISRLTDPPVTGAGRARKDNLTLVRLLRVLREDQLRSAVEKKLDELQDHCQFARDWRNRWIAHRDLALATRTPGYKPLENAPRQKVDCALAGIRDVMNTVLRHFKDSVVGYEHSIPAIGDADNLLHYMKRGKEAEQEYFDTLRASVRTPMKDAPPSGGA